MTYALMWRGRRVGRYAVQTQGAQLSAAPSAELSSAGSLQAQQTPQISIPVRMKAQLSLQGGVWGRKSISQVSHINSTTLASLYFQEVQQEYAEVRIYTVAFDAEQGLVKAEREMSSGRSRSRHAKKVYDRATLPYIQPYRDPLSILYDLRQHSAQKADRVAASGRKTMADETTEILRIPLTGRIVVVNYLGEITLTTVLGVRPARVYRLQPGGSYVYIDAAPPYNILRLRQAWDGTDILEGQLLSVDTAAAEDTLGVVTDARRTNISPTKRHSRRRPPASTSEPTPEPTSEHLAKETASNREKPRSRRRRNRRSTNASSTTSTQHGSTSSPQRRRVRKRSRKKSNSKSREDL